MTVFAFNLFIDNCFEYVGESYHFTLSPEYVITLVLGLDVSLIDTPFAFVPDLCNQHFLENALDDTYSLSRNEIPF